MKNIEKIAIFNMDGFGFDFFKKFVVIFFVFTICFNGFIPKNQSFKNILSKAVVCVANTTNFNFTDNFAERFSGIKNTISANLSKALKSLGLTQSQISKRNNKNDNESAPAKTSANNTMLLQRSVTASTLVNFIKTGSMYFYSTNMLLSALYILYSNMKLYYESVPPDVGILYFILFSIFVVKVKDIINNMNNKICYTVYRLG